MDTMTPQQRSDCMRAVKGKATLPEMIVRKWLYAQGYRFRCQYKKVPGHPDIAIPRMKTLIEIRGCFWHRHRMEIHPIANAVGYESITGEKDDETSS